MLIVCNNISPMGAVSREFFSLQCLYLYFTLLGKTLPLLSVVKPLYGHISDVLRDIPSFQSEYGIILRHILAVKDYRFHMRNRVYCSECCFKIAPVFCVRLDAK